MKGILLNNNGLIQGILVYILFEKTYFLFASTAKLGMIYNLFGVKMYLAALFLAIGISYFIGTKMIARVVDTRQRTIEFFLINIFLFFLNAGVNKIVSLLSESITLNETINMLMITFEYDSYVFSGSTLLIIIYLLFIRSYK